MLLNRWACPLFEHRLCSADLKANIFAVIHYVLFLPPCRDFQLDQKAPKNSSESAEGDQESPNIEAVQNSGTCFGPQNIIRYSRSQRDQILIEVIASKS